MTSPRKVRITAINDIRDVRILSLESNTPLEFLGGKWLMINTPPAEENGPPIKRAYSIFSSDRDQLRCEIAVKRIPGGPGSGFLHDKIAVGDELVYGGPYGKAFHIYEDDEPGPLLLAAGDTGITALVGVLAGRGAMPFLEHPLRLFWFVQDENYFLDLDLIKERMPPAAADALRMHVISPIGDLARMDEARAIMKADLARHGRPSLAFLSGDGHVIHALQTELLLYGMDLEKIRSDHFFNSTSKKAPPKNKANLRTGYTTGACSAAAAKAATRLLLTSRAMADIESVLPNGQKVVFPLRKCELRDRSAVCSVVKDAGDDPDCTHLAELIAEVELRDTPGVEIHGGTGIARVTMPGLGIEVGQPSITSIPRKNIMDMVREELEEYGGRGASVTIHILDGEERAKHTTNARLGLIGGLSILGTTGIVKPYSTGAFRTSVVQAVDVAAKRELSELVFTTGGKSEDFAMRAFPNLSQDAFIQVGDFIGTGIKHAHRRGIPRAIIFGMIGKLSKMADGVTQTHQAGSTVNMEMLANLAESLGAAPEVLEEIRATKMARRVLELAQEHGWTEIATLICERVSNVMINYAANRPKAELTHAPQNRDGNFQVITYLTDFDGNLLGAYPPEERSKAQAVNPQSE